MFNHLWEKVKIETIAICFEKVRFSQPRNKSDIQDKTQDDELMPTVEGFGDFTSSISYEAFVIMDDNVVVCREQTGAEIVAEVVSSRMQ
ncbi:hypothetical protein PR048_000988 [Dryococelus australis]|uniref:Uncharacterized protein n=1 Tax=Dryococelus australis TaxID=614101 RepID=A0ABQ9IG48_9NEOP|nr:hypothetical protein PR048_000988 [Dryococelus australis]